MSMSAGDETVAPGTMAIYDELVTAFGAAETAEVDANRKKAAAAIARGVVAHIASSAEVEVTIGTGDSGLQRSTSIGSPTDAPSAAKTIGGTVS